MPALFLIVESWVVVRKGKRFLFKARFAGSAFEKTRGIMFSPPSFAPLLFDFGVEASGARNSIHSFFCPVFDAVYLDGRKRVTQTETIRPWRLFAPAEPSRFLLELPSGAAKRFGLKTGVELNW